MSDVTDTFENSGEPGFDEIERETLREAILAQREAEREQEAVTERARQRQERDQRAQARLERQTTRARETHARRLRAAAEAHTRAGVHVAAAVRSLTSALRTLAQVPLPRFTPEAREHRRVVRGLESALSAVRRAGRGTFHETDFDQDLEID